MYIQTWNKYLNVFKILLKRAVTSEQTFQLNVSDFQKSGVNRKTGFKFSIVYKNGIPNLIGLPDIAKDLATVLMADATAKELLQQHEYQISMDKKFQMIFKTAPAVSLEAEAPALEAIAE